MDKRKFILSNGVYLLITAQGEENILHLPGRELKDEELLEIIDYIAKEDYATYEKVKSGDKEAILNDKLFEEMTDEETEYYYILFHYSNSELSSAYYRETEDGIKPFNELSASEEKRYEELLNEVKAGKLKAKHLMKVISFPEEFSGQGVEFCDYDNNYYVQKETLTDEDLLQIIDMKEREEYVTRRIDEEVRFGKRLDYPKKVADENLEITEKRFAHTNSDKVAPNLENAQIGKIVYFGKYEQDGNKENGKEDIAW